MADTDAATSPATRNGAATPSDGVIWPKPSKLEQELGVGAIFPFSNFLTESEVEVGRTDPLTVRQLVEMRRSDGQARALYRLLTLPIRAALRSSSITPHEDGGDKEAQFIEAMLTLPPSAGGMTVPWERAIAQLCMATFDGFAAFEQVYWVPKTGPLAGKLTLKKLAYRPAETVSFVTDPNGGFNGFKQRTVFQGRAIDVKIDRENALYYAANEEENPFYGVSYFASAYYHFDKKVKVYYLAHLAAQTRAVGTRLGILPPNPSAADRAAFRTALADFGAAQAMLVPSGYQVTNWAPAAAFDYMALISHHNSQMSKSVLAQFFDENDGSRTSLVDFSENNSSVFFLMLQAIMDEVEGVINRYLIPKFIDWNLGSGKYPQFRFGPFTDEQQKAIHSTFQALCTVPTPGVTKEFMRELEKKMAEEMGLEVDYDAVAQREAEEQEMQAAQFGFAPASPAESQPPPSPGGNPTDQTGQANPTEKGGGPGRGGGSSSSGGGGSSPGGSSGGRGGSSAGSTVAASASLDDTAPTPRNGSAEVVPLADPTPETAPNDSAADGWAGLGPDGWDALAVEFEAAAQAALG